MPAMCVSYLQSLLEAAVKSARMPTSGPTFVDSSENIFSYCFFFLVCLLLLFVFGFFLVCLALLLLLLLFFFFFFFFLSSAG